MPASPVSPQPQPQPTQSPPEIRAAVLLRREDGRALLVRHRPDDPQFPGQWSLPMETVGAEEVAETAAERALRERLHVGPGAVAFAQTLYLPGAGEGRYVVNVFTCEAWGGDPRFSDRDYEDAAWVEPAAPPPALELVPELRRWLAEQFGGGVLDRDGLAREIEDTRRELLQAFEAIPDSERAPALRDGWSALDLLALASSAEAYLGAEARRMLETPGHTWRPFNESQWEDDHRPRPRETEPALRSRLAKVARSTSAWLEALHADALGAYGNHPNGGVVTVGDRVQEIARYHHRLADRLRELAQAARVQAGAGKP